MPITDRDIAALCLGIYPEHFSPAAWDHFDPGSDLDGVCWGLKHVGDVSIVVLRGTVTLLDWLRDFQAWVEPFHHHGLGPIHAGFYSGMETVYRELPGIVQSRPLIICGHSAGAARAVLLSALLTLDGRPPIARICFGEPRAGFAQLRPILAPIKQQRSYRNRGATDTDHDEMTDLPFSLPLFPYQHPTDLMDLTVAPMPHTLWVFRFHVPELYAEATPTTLII
jgi:Lipase (class 3)